MRAKNKLPAKVKPVTPKTRTERNPVILIAAAIKRLNEVVT